MSSQVLYRAQASLPFDPPSILKKIRRTRESGAQTNELVDYICQSCMLQAQEGMAEEAKKAALKALTVP